MYVYLYMCVNIYLFLHVDILLENSMYIKTVQTYFGLIYKMELDSEYNQSFLNLYSSYITKNLLYITFKITLFCIYM